MRYLLLLALLLPSFTHAAWTTIYDDGGGVRINSDLGPASENGFFYSPAMPDWRWYEDGFGPDGQQAIDDAYSYDPSVLPSVTNALSLGYEWPCEWSPDFSPECPDPPATSTPTTTKATLDDIAFGLALIFVVLLVMLMSLIISFRNKKR